jgi:hypothetical protein
MHSDNILPSEYIVLYSVCSAYGMLIANYGVSIKTDFETGQNSTFIS